MRYLWGLLSVLVICGAAWGADWKSQLPPLDKVAAHLQNISVTIRAGSAEGSGVLKTRQRGDTRITYVWTAAHVVENQRSTEEIIDASTGTKREVVKFSDCAIVREEVQDGRRVGESKLDVKVIRYSKDEDLALLEVRKRNWTDASTVFYRDAAIPAIGTRLFHVGSLLGQQGSNSMTSGIVSQIGRVLPEAAEKEFDQTTVTAFPGSSGGGVYLENGAYVGMLVRGAGEQFNLIVPVRRIQKWAEKAKLLWAFDDSVPLPSEADFEKLPVEDSGRTFSGGAAAGAHGNAGPAPMPPRIHLDDKASRFPVLTFRP